MKPLVEIDSLAVDFTTPDGVVNAVRGVGFKVEPGEILGIVGESGSGKSVSCRALLGLLPRHARVGGRIVYDGRELSTLTPAELAAVRGRQVSMIFQNPSSHLDPLMTIGEQVAEPMKFHFGLDRRAARRRALELLEVVRIQDAGTRMNAYPHELSGGMKQRVLIACALACEPRLLLADEPTTALDVTVQAGILRLLRTLNRERGLSMILVSHDLGVVAEVCDRVVVMRGGEVVEQGTVTDVVRQPRNAYTRELIDSQPGRLEMSSGRHARPAPLLEVKGLRVRFARRGGTVAFGGDKTQGIDALADVSLDVHAGETFGIVGESGSGKSTLARAVLGLVDTSAGSIRYDGRALAGLDKSERARFRRDVQMVFQSPYDSLNPRMRVLDAIAEPIWRHRLADPGEAGERAAELMDMVELSPALARRKPRQLSGGQCQRVAIARALALSPRLLIADEVTSALDVTIQAQVLRLLARLKEMRDLTIIYISHDLAVVRRFCNRVAVLKQGRLMEVGYTRTVFESPSSEYTRELIASAPDLDALRGGAVPA